MACFASRPAGPIERRNFSSARGRSDGGSAGTCTKSAPASRSMVASIARPLHRNSAPTSGAIDSTRSATAKPGLK